MNTSAKKTIVAFHIGRGGHFNNPGHKTFIGSKEINEFTNNLYLQYENSYEIFEKIEGHQNLTELYNQVIDKIWDEESDLKEKFEKKTGLRFGERVYFAANGEKVGLSYTEANTGIGTINIDNDYDTTYTLQLTDCGEAEINLIIDSREWNREELLAEMAEFYGFDALEIKLMNHFNDWKNAFDNYAPQFKDGVVVKREYIEENFEVRENEDDCEGNYLEVDGKFYDFNN